MDALKDFAFGAAFVAIVVAGLLIATKLASLTYTPHVVISVVVVLCVYLLGRTMRREWREADFGDWDDE